MVLVVACTLAQVHLGTWGAVAIYMRSWLVWWDVPGTVFSLPIFPGGALVGLVLGVNLIAAQLKRLELSWKKVGLWLVHAGLVLLFAGEFVAGMTQVDTNMSIEVGQTVNYVESHKKWSWPSSTRPTPPATTSTPCRTRCCPRRGTIAVPGTPITLQREALLPERRAVQTRRPGRPSMATAGRGDQRRRRGAAPGHPDDAINADLGSSSPWRAAAATAPGWSPSPRRAPVLHP